MVPDITIDSQHYARTPCTYIRTENDIFSQYCQICHVRIIPPKIKLVSSLLQGIKDKDPNTEIPLLQSLSIQHKYLYTSSEC